MLLTIYRHTICIQYKSGPDLNIADWLSRQNHTENKDEEIESMKLSIFSTTDIPTCMSIQNIHEATQLHEKTTSLEACHPTV